MTTAQSIGVVMILFPFACVAIGTLILIGGWRSAAVVIGLVGWFVAGFMLLRVGP